MFPGMALLQALFSLISRSAGKILNAIFGWAVRALFGQPSPKEQPFLTGVVAAAAAWPVLLVGVAFPKLAALVVAFIPFHNRAPAWTLRVAWIVLALIVPMLVGIAVASKAPPGAVHEPVWKRLLRGWPITLGLASAFLIMFVTVPALKLASIVRRRQDEQIPLVTHASSYHDVAEVSARTLRTHGFDLAPATPGWWVSAPTRILRKLGGDAFRNYVPEKLAYFREPNNRGLEAALYPNGLLLRGNAKAVARAHSLVSEALSHTEALQTMDPAAQALEQRVHSLWATCDRDAPAQRESPQLLGALRKLAADVARADLPFADWQVLYRELLQLDRALRGHGQLIIEAEAEAQTMRQNDPSAMGTADLLKELAADSALLAKRQLLLAELEAKREVKRGVKSAELFGASGLFAYAALIMLFVAGALALGSALGQTLVVGALAVAAVLLMPAVITGIVGYRRVKRIKPMARTRAELAKEMEWTKSLTTTT
jgi:Putative Actinobacterial Holin-X, holin superfamily III